MKNHVLYLFAALLFLPVMNTEAQTKERKRMEIVIKIGRQQVAARLHDTPIARDFASRLPLTLQLRDYAGTEKIAALPGKKLDMKDAPAGMDPAIGDITWYAPWGNLAIFYRDFGYASGLIPLGKITSGLEHLKSLKREVTVRIFRVQ